MDPADWSFTLAAFPAKDQVTEDRNSLPYRDQVPAFLTAGPKKTFRSLFWNLFDEDIQEASDEQSGKDNE